MIAPSFSLSIQSTSQPIDWLANIDLALSKVEEEKSIFRQSSSRPPSSLAGPNLAWVSREDVRPPPLSIDQRVYHLPGQHHLTWIQL